mgnify:CR=1 FL=1
MAAALQRLAMADHLESRAFESAVQLRKSTPGAGITHRHRVQAGLAVIDRDRATAPQDLVNADDGLEVDRHQFGRDAVERRIPPNAARSGHSRRIATVAPASAVGWGG